MRRGENSVIAAACFFGLIVFGLCDLLTHLIDGTPL